MNTCTDLCTAYFDVPSRAVWLILSTMYPSGQPDIQMIAGDVARTWDLAERVSVSVSVSVSASVSVSES